jgi:hypothetical protein
VKAKHLQFKFLGNGLHQALTMDGSYCIYEPKMFPGVDTEWSIQVRHESGNSSHLIKRATLDAAKARCEELHQETFAELIEYWGAPE